MKPLKLCYFSAHSLEIPSLAAGLQLFRQRRVSAFVQQALALGSDSKWKEVTPEE